MKKTTFYSITAGLFWALVAVLADYTLTDWQVYVIVIPGIFVFSTIYHFCKDSGVFQDKRTFIYAQIGYIKLTNQRGKPIYINVRAIMNYIESEPYDDFMGKSNTVLTYLDDRDVNVQETVEEIDKLIEGVTFL